MVKSKRKSPNNKKQLKNSVGKSVAKRRGKSRRYCKTTSTNSVDEKCVFTFTNENNQKYIIFKSEGINYLMLNLPNFKNASLSKIDNNVAMAYLLDTKNKTYGIGKAAHIRTAKLKLESEKKTEEGMQKLLYSLHEDDGVARPAGGETPNTTSGKKDTRRRKKPSWWRSH